MAEHLKIQFRQFFILVAVETYFFEQTSIFSSSPFISTTNSTNKYIIDRAEPVSRRER